MQCYYLPWKRRDNIIHQSGKRQDKIMSQSGKRQDKTNKNKLKSLVHNLAHFTILFKILNNLYRYCLTNAK